MYVIVQLEIEEDKSKRHDVGENPVHGHVAAYLHGYEDCPGTLCLVGKVKGGNERYLAV